MDGGLRGHDLARNPGMGSDTEYSAGEFPLPTRPPAGTATQSTSKPPSKFRSQETEESFSDLGSMKRELERAQRERDKTILDRDQATLERDQAKLDHEQTIFEQDKAIHDWDLLMAERVQEQRLQESAWTMPEPMPSVRGLETKPIGPLMEIALPGYTPSSTGGSQTGTGSSRLKELQERLQSKARDNSA